MKAFFLIATTLLSFQSFAGNWQYSCESTDGKIKLTRENLVIIEKEDIGEIRSIIHKPANDTVNTGPTSGETLVYKDSFEGKTQGDVTIKFSKLISENEVESNETDCPPGDSGGHGPGSNTIKKILNATVEYYDNTSKVDFTCFETFSWSGRCHFDGEDN